MGSKEITPFFECRVQKNKKSSQRTKEREGERNPIAKMRGRQMRCINLRLTNSIRKSCTHYYRKPKERNF